MTKPTMRVSAALPVELGESTWQTHVHPVVEGLVGVWKSIEDSCSGRMCQVGCNRQEGQRILRIRNNIIQGVRDVNNHRLDLRRGSCIRQALGAYTNHFRYPHFGDERIGNDALVHLNTICSIQC
jgi:hypothetical protein